MIDLGYNIFETTMEGFEHAFQVQHITTFNLLTCNIDDDVHELRERFPSFDQMPVSDGVHIIGVVEPLSIHGAGTVRDYIQPLQESMLVAAHQPLADFLPVLADQPSYRLVLKGTRISGIVTRSDVLKLPVRLLAFALVTHLEMTMSALIQRRWTHTDAWLAALPSKRKQNVLRKQSLFQQRRQEPPLIELTEFADKRTLVARGYGLAAAFEDELKDVEELRHKIAHAGNYAEDAQQLTMFLTRIHLAKSWLTQLQQLDYDNATSGGYLTMYNVSRSDR